MFVSQINIQEFKGIKNCGKPLEFSEFTLLIGRNNSGKSSVLEALSLLPLPDAYNLQYYGNTRLQLLTALHGGRSSIVYGYSGTASLDYVIANKTWRVKFKESGSANYSIENVEQSVLSSDPLNGVAIALGVDPNPKINNMVFFIPNDTSFLDTLSQRLRVEPYPNLVTKLGANVSVAKELINECVDDKYTEIFFTPEMRARKEMPDGKVLYVKIRDLGDGVEKAALVALWLEAIKPALVLWDDFEASAHPTLIKVLLNWLCNKDWQIVLSTHSIDVLNNLLDVKPKNAKVLQLKKTADDILIHQDLSLDDLESLFEANQDPRILVDRLGL
jgi:energy-coupling factor transporter ATP-binding protein EcfA2